MPLRLLHQTFEAAVETADDVRARFEWGMSLSPATGRARYEKSVRDLADYFFYVGAIRPDYARPLQYELVTASDAQLANFAFTFPTWLALLQGAPDACVEPLTRRLAADDAPPMVRFTLEQMLASILTPTALGALGDYARARDCRSQFAALGFWIPPTHGAAVARFTSHRMAARVRRDESRDPDEFRHPVGLPLSAVMADPAQDIITWHYCSLDLSALPDVPEFPVARIHLVSPQRWNDWTVFCALGRDGRYINPQLVSNASEDDDEDLEAPEAPDETQATASGELILLPYDDQLIYANSHVMLTPDVVGDIGGPPIGLYANPTCPTCDRLMFHVATFSCAVREYGDGFRSLFLCEGCGRVASHATPWN